MNNKEKLKNVIERVGPLKTARVSSAQACGNAKRFSYWGATRYNIIINYKGNPSNIAKERASSDRRSLRLAEKDLIELCLSEDRARLDVIGELSEENCKSILKVYNGKI